MSNRKDQLIQLWISHNNFFWQQVRAIPFVEAVVLAGAYKLYKDNENSLAIAVLSLGVILFLMIGLMINRHRQHAKKFREDAGEAIPNPGNPFLGLRSDWIATSTPLIIALFNVVLIFALCE